jgi:hypothetical protein
VSLVSLLVILDVSAASPSKTPASYPSCGNYWNRNTPVTAAERRVNACIVKASRDGRRARAVATLTTIEGDPIVNYVFVRDRHDVLVVVDTTRDAFGARTWQRLRCTGLVITDDRFGWTRCRSVGTGKPAWLVPIRLSG